MKFILSLFLLINLPKAFANENSYANQNLLASAYTRAPSSKSKYITKERYIIGGVLATIVGGGLGHLVQGRYLRTGWIFTAGELLTFIGFVWSVTAHLDDNDDFTKAFDNNTTTFFAVAYSIFHIWGIVDAWLLPKDLQISKFKLNLRPFYTKVASKDSYKLGLSLNLLF